MVSLRCLGKHPGNKVFHQKNLGETTRLELFGIALLMTADCRILKIGHCTQLVLISHSVYYSIH